MYALKRGGATTFSGREDEFETGETLGESIVWVWRGESGGYELSAEITTITAATV